MFFDDRFYWMLKNFEDAFLNDSMIINKPFTPEQFLKSYFHSATDLDNRSLDILTYIILSADESGIYHGTYDDLMTKFNISRATLAAVMNQLQEKQFLTRIKDGLKISNKIKIPSKKSNIIIRFGNSPEKNNFEIKDSNVEMEKNPFEENKYSQIDESDFMAFIKAINLSKEYLKENPLIDNNCIEDIRTLVKEYNDSITNKPISFSEYVLEKNTSEPIIEYIKIYENQYLSNPNHLPYVPDNLSYDSYNTFQKYSNEIDLTNFSNETKTIMKELMLDIIKLNNFLNFGISFDNVKEVFDLIYNNPQEAREFFFAKGINHELVNSIVKKVSTSEGNCLRAYFNLKAATNIIINYRILKEQL